MAPEPGVAAAVRRRRVLYLSGFDPQGAPRYHRLYREQAGRQAEVSGHRIEVGRRIKDTPQRDHWDIEAEIEGRSCSTRYEFLRWDDVVRSHWPSGHAAYLRLTLGTSWRFLRTGLLLQLMRTSLPGFSVCAGPALICLALLGLALACVAAAIAVWLTLGPAWGTVGVAVAGLASWGLLRLSRHAETDWYLGWVMRSYASLSRQGRGLTPDIEARLDAHAEHLLACLADPAFDEVLVVGHSSGAMLGASVVGRALLRDPDRAADPRLALLTLGQCFPVLSYQRTARGFRAELAAAGAALGPRWLDLTAPADRCCAALVDPIEVVRAYGEPAGRSPKLLSPQFQRLFDAPAYAALRRDLFAMHFQYIHAGALPGAYDYYAITAGPQRLEERFAAQPGVTGYTALQCLGGPFPRAAAGADVPA